MWVLIREGTHQILEDFSGERVQNTSPPSVSTLTVHFLFVVLIPAAPQQQQLTVAAERLPVCSITAFTHRADHCSHLFGLLDDLNVRAVS